MMTASGQAWPLPGWPQCPSMSSYCSGYDLWEGCEVLVTLFRGQPKCGPCLTGSETVAKQWQGTNETQVVVCRSDWINDWINDIARLNQWLNQWYIQIEPMIESMIARLNQSESRGPMLVWIPDHLSTPWLHTSQPSGVHCVWIVRNTWVWLTLVISRVVPVCVSSL